MKYPAELYTASAKIYRGLPDKEYPFHDQTIMVTKCGRICFNNKKVNFSTVFAGQKVGITEVEDKIWLVPFMQFDLGYFDEESCRVEPLDHPFKEKLLPMSAE
jgi:putative transposase